MSRCNLKRTLYSLQAGEGLQGRDFRLKNMDKVYWLVEIHQVFTLGITQLMEDMKFYFAYPFDERNSYLWNSYGCLIISVLMIFS
jgi:hypothetical protein